ncbi:Zn clus domain containing protein [Pyrenophora tritici-repentis]|nr:hypothetical protein L13192_07996 [Pyrenophora tritici-repentis]KAI2476003.1 Zn clus domain containing protein [Pyrenophora tritici-repentis]
MPDTPLQLHRQPKLRASCDECGAAKLRCDRSHPTCGRCLSLGLVCIYGVSRKAGKPSRKTLQISSEEETDIGSTSDCYIHSLLPSVESTDGGDGLRGDIFGALFPDFPPPELGDAFNNYNIDTGALSTMDPAIMSTLESLNPADCSIPLMQTDVPVPLYQHMESGRLDDTWQLPAESKHHDCFLEAYKILGRLAFQGSNQTPCMPQSPTMSVSAVFDMTHDVPLDHMLRCNRESSERLGRLLTCLCLSSPHHALLYASIIDRMLSRYQEATTDTLAAASYHVSPSQPSPVSRSGSGSDFSAWSSVTCSTGTDDGGLSDSIATSSHTRPNVKAAKVAIGNFNVDDIRVQTALKIQLLSGEMGRVKDLIDQFDLYKCNGGSDEYTFGGGNGLFETLSSWLRSEHSKLANSLRSKLRELNT